jgi:competence protein ComEA
MQTIVLTRRRVLLGALVLALVLVVGARFVVRAGSAAGPGAPPIIGSAEASAGGGAGGGAAPVVSSKLVVYVVGAVRRPGVYRLAEGTRIEDAVLRAGGTTPRADLIGVNLAAPLVDGEQVLVPARLPAAVAAAEGLPGSSGGGAVPPAGGAVPAGPVQLSVATVEQLDTLPGIGPVTAQKIVDYRTAHGAFRSVDALDDVPGIGPSRVEQLRGLVVP